MRFAGATFEKGKPRGRLHTEGYATLHNADGGRCLLDPKLIPVYTPGPASVYAVFNLPRARTPGLPFGRSTVERIADPLAPPRTAHLQKSTSERYCDAHPRDDDESTLFKGTLSGWSAVPTRESAPAAPRRPWTYGDGRRRKPRVRDHGCLYNHSTTRRGRSLARGWSDVNSDSTVMTASVGPRPSALFTTSKKYTPLQYAVATDAVPLRPPGADSPGPCYLLERGELPDPHPYAALLSDAPRWRHRDAAPELRCPTPSAAHYDPDYALCRDARAEMRLASSGRHRIGGADEHLKYVESPGPVYGPDDSKKKRWGETAFKGWLKSHHAMAHRGPRFTRHRRKHGAGPRERNLDWIH